MAMTCSACGTTLVEGARFCFGCGAPATLACASCGTELADGARFCFGCGTPVDTPAQPPATSPVAERRVTSVLFGDLVGFTTLSESRDPEEVRELLGRYFDTSREIVARYGGTIEKFIGDAVMAVWGVPTAHEDDAERAVRAGLDLAEAVAAFGESVGAPGLAMRVGVVTGEVAVTIGATGQGMVAGDAVNTAARVQAKAEPGTVWVDDQTRSLTRGAIDFVQVGLHELKGKAEPVELFAATAVMGGVGGERSTDRVQAPLVGRRRELSVLKEMFHVAAEEGRPRLVVMSGDAGVGKTRLGWEFQNYIDGLSATVLWHRGRCLAYGDGVAFSALNGAVRGRIGANDDDTEATTRAKLTLSLETYVPDDSERARLTAALVNLLGLAGASGQTRPDLFSAWLTWFERLSRAQGQPIVWLVDDAHYADDGLLDFIEHLSTVAQAPILIVLLARPELLPRRPALAALRRANVIGLETLLRADIVALLDSLVEGLPTDVRDALVDRAEGNPLYAIETVRAMHDQGLTVGGPTRTPGAVRLATGVDADRLNAVAAPASLQVLVASRLDLLPSPERSVLAAASVLGHTFSLGALEATSRRSQDLPQILRDLIGRDLLTTVTDRLSSEEGQYAFVQTVVRTVAYQTQSRRDRLHGHLAVVTYLESFADSDSELSTVIAQHLRDALSLVGPDEPQHAEIADQLARWLERSADRSRAVGAPSEAARTLGEALALVGSPDDEIRLRLAAADAALEAGALEDCVDYARPVVVGDLGAQRADVARAAAASATALRWLARVDEGWALLEPYLADGALADLPTLTAAMLARQVSASLAAQGRSADGGVWADRALVLAEDAGDPREIVNSLNSYAVRANAGALPRVAVAVVKLAADIAREHGLVYELSTPLINLIAFGMNSDAEAAFAAASEGMSLCEQAGANNQCWHVAINLSILLTSLGRWDEVAVLQDRPLLSERPPTPPQAAVVELENALIAFARDEEVDLEALDALAALGETGQTPTVDYLFYAADRGMYARVKGDTAALVRACRHTVEIASKLSPIDDDFPNLWSLSVGWMIDAEDFDGARELLRPVLEIPPTRWNPLLAVQLLRLRGTIEAADLSSTADPSDVERDLLDGIAALDEFGAAPDRARAQAALGLWLTQQGRSVEAAPLLAAARETFTDLRATAWLRELDSALSLAAAG